VQGARRFLDDEVLRQRAGAQGVANRTAVVPIDRDSFMSAPASASRPFARSRRTRAGKNSSSHGWIVGISPDQKIDRPPNASCGFSPMKN
jgi:hypothetical protein